MTLTSPSHPTMGSGACPYSAASKADPALPTTATSPASPPSPTQPTTTSSPSLLTKTRAMRNSRADKSGLPLILWALISPLRLLALGLLLGHLLPPLLTLLAFTLLAILPAVRTGLRHLHLLPTPYASRIIPGRTTSVIRGDFVVFLIGSRVNSAFPFTRQSMRVGRAFQQMLAQLEASDPEVSGFLGADPYVGSHPARSTTLSVQYWRSYEHLHRWARAADTQHLAIWKMFSSSKGEQVGAGGGIWHEAYLVRDGEYEVVYSGLPPMGLALASGNVQAAVGALRTSAGRVKGKQHLDTPPEGFYEKPDPDAQSTTAKND